MQTATEKQATTFSCPSCGGRPVWDPASLGLLCPFCGTKSTVDLTPVRPAEYDINDAPTPAQMDWGDEKRSVRCQARGAETILDRHDTANLCPFCGSPHVLDDQSGAGIAPESTLPFRVTKDAAAAAFSKWLKGKLFAPSAAKKAAKLDHVSGVYLPHWTFDDNASAQYIGEEGHYYYVTVPVVVERNGKRVTEMRRERRTRWSPTSGHVAQYFDDVVIPASERLPQNLLERVQPYNLDYLCDYKAEFLSGFVAEKPAVNVQSGWDSAQQKIESELRSMAYSDIRRHADEARVHHIDAKHRNVRYKLTLLPMYLSSFTYKKKLFHVLVNGQTGRCGGQAPVSPWRVLIAVLLGLALIAGIYYLVESGSDSSGYVSTMYFY